MNFRKSKTKENIQISIGSKLINKVKETNFLGVVIDDQLNRLSHEKQIVAKLQKSYYRIKTASILLSMASLIMIYDVCHICFTVVKFGGEPVRIF